MIHNSTKEKAVVIGGGIAGLYAARVISEHYNEVVVVERDDLPAQPADRPGTPQSYHPHRFTQRGKSITESLFPGFEDDLAAQGAPSSLNKTVHNMNRHGSVVATYPRNDYKFSRALLESVIRQRVRNIANVRFLTGNSVVGLTATPDSQAVTGVRIRERGRLGRESELQADFVVDTSGRSSKLADWLESLGYEVPQPDLLKTALGYSTRRYKVPAGQSQLIDKWDVINMAGNPATGTFTGVLSFIENREAELLLYRPGGHYPPTNSEMFEQTVSGLPSSIIADITKELEPLASPSGFRVPALYRQRYDRMERWPSGLLAMGDALCIYDPIYGQGMTVAAIEAETLESSLREQRDEAMPNFERLVLARMQRQAVEPAWWLNCAADLQWEGVQYEGTEPMQGIAFVQKYMDLLLEQATAGRNYELFGLYWAVNSLAVPPAQLMDPQTVERVLTASEEGRRWLDELLATHGEPLGAVLQHILPSFCLASGEQQRP